MIQFLSQKLWQRIAAISKKAKARRAAIAYVTSDPPLSLKTGDTLVVNASDGAIAGGETSAKVLAALHRRGVRLFSYGRLHAKVVVLDGTAFTSSANLSQSSQNTLLEAGLETDNPTAVAQAIAFIETLTEQSELVDRRFITRIDKIPVKKNWHPNGNGKKVKKLKLSDDPKTWLIGVHSVDDPRDPAELRRIEKGEAAATELISNPKSETSWVRFGKTFRVSRYAKRGDSFVVIWRSKNNGSPEAVYHHSPVLLNQSEPSCNRIYYESFANSEQRALGWREFKSLAKRIGLPTPSKNAVRQLTKEQSSALHELWNEARKK